MFVLSGRGDNFLQKREFWTSGQNSEQKWNFKKTTKIFGFLQILEFGILWNACHFPDPKNSNVFRFFVLKPTFITPKICRFYVLILSFLSSVRHFQLHLNSSCNKLWTFPAVWRQLKHGKRNTCTTAWTTAWTRWRRQSWSQSSTPTTFTRTRLTECIAKFVGRPGIWVIIEILGIELHTKIHWQPIIR